MALIGQGRNIGNPERWASATGGAALAAFGISRKSWFGAGLAGMGALLVYRGVSGHCDVKAAWRSGTAERIDSTVTVSKPAEEVFEFWRNLENLPKFMDHIQSVERTSPTQSHWKVKGPAGTTIEWDAEIVNERPGRALEWRSLPGSTVESWGAVRFQPKQGGRGTKVHVSFQYKMPAGAIGQAVNRWFGEEPREQVQHDLDRFKEMMEVA